MAIQCCKDVVFLLYLHFDSSNKRRKFLKAHSYKTGKILNNNSKSQQKRGLMNLISCSKDCAYQKDGYCCLTDTAYVNNNKVDGCCYYRKLSQPPADTAQKKPVERV